MCILTDEITEATVWLKKSIAILPYFPEAHFNLGSAYQKLGELGNMVRSYRKTVEFGDPSEKYYQEARSMLDRAAEMFMKNDGVDIDCYLEAGLKFKQAFILLEAGDWEGALAGFKRAAAIHFHNAPTHGNMALCLAQLGRKADALVEFSRALEIDPQYEPAMNNRLLVEEMEEGTPLQIGYESINFSMDAFKRNKERG